jgi:hypothetical protein
LPELAVHDGPHRCGRGDGLERPPQHLLLEPLQPGRRVEAELVAEPVAVAGQGGERVGGTAGLGEGGDQQLDGPLPPWLLGRDDLEGGRGLGHSVQPEQQLRPVLLGGQAELVEAQGLPAGEGRRELGVGRASPEGEGLVKQPERGHGRPGAAGLAEQGGETLGVDRLAGHLEQVAGRPGGDDRPGRSEGLAEPDDVGLQRVPGLPGRGLAEHPVDQPLHRDDVAAVEQERGQQGPLASSRHLDGPAGDPHLERPQDAELDLVRLPGHPGIFASLRPRRGGVFRRPAVRRLYATGVRLPGARAKTGP